MRYVVLDDFVGYCEDEGYPVTGIGVNSEKMDRIVESALQGSLDVLSQMSYLKKDVLSQKGGKYGK